MLHKIKEQIYINCIKMKKIKLCIISHFGYPLYNYKCKSSFGGGAEVQLYLLSKELAKHKELDINVITGNCKKNLNKRELFKDITLYKILPVEKKFINYLKGFVNLFFYLIKINPDIVIQRVGGIETGLCSIYCKLLNKIFIFSIAHKVDVTKGAKKQLHKYFYLLGLRNADLIIAQNKSQIIDLENWKKKKIPNIKTIKNGYEINEFKILKKKRKYILWVGRAVKWKRPEKFIKLASKFPNEKFLMVCQKDNNNEYWKELSKKVNDFPNLELKEFIPFRRIDRFFRNSKVLINTSTYEGFPNTFLQAFKNKTPVISLNVDPDKILTTEHLGFNCHNDFNNMKIFLKLILENAELSQSYSNNAFLFVKKYHNIRDICLEWINLIKKIIRYYK